MALAKSLSKLYGISSEIKHYGGCSSCYFYFVSGFISKVSYASNDNRIQSLESQVNLCMYGGHHPGKSDRLLIRSDQKYIEIEPDDCCIYGDLKTQNLSVLDLRLQEVIFPSLVDFLDGDKEEMLFCPVRAVKCYLSYATVPP